MSEESKIFPRNFLVRQEPSRVELVEGEDGAFLIAPPEPGAKGTMEPTGTDTTSSHSTRTRTNAAVRPFSVGGEAFHTDDFARATDTDSDQNDDSDNDWDGVSDAAAGEDIKSVSDSVMVTVPFAERHQRFVLKRL